MRELDIHEQRANGYFAQLGQVHTEDILKVADSRPLGNIRSDARKRIMGEWDQHMETLVPEVTLFEPKNPGHTISSARHRIMEGK